MNKATRLELLRKIGEQVREREELVFAEGIPLSDREITETASDMEAFQEELRDRRSASDALNSDEA